ncbi:MAG TPA: ClbS/DfsB family four-helix bundle protein, partial [Thermomicrobiales bacterium]
MTGTGTKEGLLAQIENEREQWNRLVTEVGTERMEEPGAMGEWSFKDLASHLTGWRERTIARVGASPGQEIQLPWPDELVEDDEINAWLYERDHNRPLADILLE